MKTHIIRDYPFEAAGRTWSVPRLELLELPDGSRALSQAEITRVHAAIANEICGSSSSLTIDELDFLCDITETPVAAVAESLGLHRSTLSKWRAAGEISKTLYTLHLKRWFWFMIFGDQLREQSISFDHLRDEQEFLRYAHERAIHERLADPVELLAA